ncbi:MAG: hypothetical protein JWQ09_374 [Segetibacter sp.]|nr:hypothetical protein [Segetibacter sp.]
MKMLSVLLYALLMATCSNAKEITYTGSTPADAVVKDFLGISQKDSVDFIRWRLVISEQHYTLQCNYGIGKPNTSGFMNGGINITTNGSVQKEHNYYRISNGNKKLNLAALNADLLHILNNDDTFLTGNGGWSYTLNNIHPQGSNHINFAPPNTAIHDSMTFVGRTPCDVPGIIEPGALCYKLKWEIVLYGNAKENKPTTYKVFGTPWRKEGGRQGNWQIINSHDERIVYQLNDETGKGFLYLLKADENILLFTDSDGKLLTGNEDFSFTLNKML